MKRYFRELCRSFNFSVALGADPPRKRFVDSFQGDPRRAGSAERSRALFILPTFYPTGAPGREESYRFSDPELRSRTPPLSFDKSAPLGRDNCFSGLPPLERRKRSSSRLSISVSGILFATRWRRHRLSFRIFLTAQTVGGKEYRTRKDRPSISIYPFGKTRIYGSDIALDKI